MSNTFEFKDPKDSEKLEEKNKNNFLEKNEDEVLPKKSLEEEYIEKLKFLEQKESSLLKREKEILAKELEYNKKKYQMQNNFIDENNKKFRKLFEDRENSFTKSIEEIMNKEIELYKKLDNLYSSKISEYSMNFANIHSQVTEKLNEEEKIFRNNLAEMEDKLKKQKEILLDKELDLENTMYHLEAREKSLQIREENIEIKFKNLIEEKERNFEKDYMFLQDELEKTRKEMLIYKQYKIDIDKFNEEYDGDLSKLLEEKKLLIAEIKEKEEEITKIQNEWYDKNKNLKDLNEQLKEELDKARMARDSIIEKYRIDDYNKLLIDKSFLEVKNKELNAINDSLKNQNACLQEENNRLSFFYKEGSAREERIKVLYKPYLKSIPEDSYDINIEEKDWLKNIYEKIKDYGFDFSERLLYSFHTSLKTAEWSPLTVLSGVSGTGKSELPKLYSHFGGFNFMPVSVQPNWDSQEAMLGFFNSIENKFDAQPLLRFLVQTQQTEYSEHNITSLEDYMNIILLDEMNLAHIELYFADFLSKLELRRGKGRSDVPALEIKLGIGMEEFKLKLGRNVLWVGTINQDETTKTLSDKVIDRGMIINFPRPATFARRKELKQLGKQEKLLKRGTWDKWWKSKCILADTEIEKYKRQIEDINGYLSNMGRALGNRVWQSIEYYMNNYPVQNEDGLKNAFEDQLVLKVMPKLQGIECRGKNKSLLDEISNKLPDTLQNDFNNARNNNDGYFYWSSSDYLNKNDVNKNQKENSTDNEHESNDNQ